MSRYMKKRIGKKRLVSTIATSGVAAVAMAAIFLFAGCSSSDSSSDISSQTSEIPSNPEDQVLVKGISIGGVDVAGMTKEQALEAVAADPDALPAYNLTLKLKDKTWNLTEKDMTFQSNAEDAVNQAFDYLYGDNGANYTQRVSQLKENPVDYEVKYTLDYTKLNEKLKALTEEMNVKPVDATVSSFDSSTGTFQFKDGKNGLAVEEEKLYADVKAALEQSPTATVEVPYKEVEFSKTAAQIKSNMQKLGSYSTVSTNNANANHNMKLALASANGTVLQPGEIFSFNSTTGNTTNGSLGYKKAGAIVGGKLIDEYGGGICQASTTIYGAAVRSNMKILTRYNHAWPSTYCPIGQDAAVSYGSLDLRFQNTSEYPIYIVAGMSGTKLTVTFYGYQDPSYDEIRVTSQQTGTIAQPADVYQVDKSLKKDEIVKDRSGRVGKRASAQRVYYKNGSVVKRENLPSSYYRELSTVYRYGPGSSVPGSDSSSSSSSSSAPASSSASSSSSTPASSSAPSSSSAPAPSSAPSSSSTPASSSAPSSSSAPASSSESSSGSAVSSDAPSSAASNTSS